MAKRQKLWTNILSNFAIICLTFSVGLVCFTPNEAVTTAGKEKVYRSGYSKSGVSLMFNVYWGTEEVYQILDILDEYEAKSTFFIGGCWADDNVQCLKDIAERGHEIGNHGYFHKQHDKLSETANREEILRCNQFISLAIGAAPQLFAPPSGAYSDATLSAASRLQMKTVLWTKDTIDWRDKDQDLIYKRATNNLSNGDLVLMHPKEHTLKVLPKILDYYDNLGYNIVTVSENIL